MVMKFNHKLIKTIVIILIVCLLSLALTSSSADALVTEVLLTGACAVNPAVALAVAGTILVGAGLTFDNQEKLEVMAAALINNNPVINNLIGGFECMAAASAEFFDFNLTQAAVDELGGWLDGLFSASEVGSTVGTLALPATLGHLTLTYQGNDFDVPYIPFIPNVDIAQIDNYDFSSVPYLSDLLLSNGFTLDSSDSLIVLPFGIYRNYTAFLANGFYSDGSPTRHFDNTYAYYKCFEMGYAYSLSATALAGNNFPSISKLFFTESNGTYYFVVDGPGKTAGSHLYPFSSSISVSGSTVGVASSSAAADSTFFPQSLDNDKKLTPGIPLTVPESLTNLVDLPVEGVRNVSTDIPVDDPFSTVGDISGEGTGTGIFEGIGNWILNIPILGTIARTISSIFELLQGFLAALINAFTGLLDGVVEGITNFFNGIPDVIRAIRDFLANIFNKLGDILAALVGFIGRILAFIPDIVTFLLSYELFGSLISKFIPQPVAVVMIAFFLGTVCIWLFRWILNR